MTDIVTRLREETCHAPECCWLFSEAADEIERLRADVKRWSNWAIDYACDDTKCECDRCTEVRKAWDEAQRNH